MTDGELNEVYYQPDRLSAGGKVIKELHKINSIPKKDVKSWLSKRALGKVQIPAPKEVKQPHYNMAKPSEQYQFDLLYDLLLRLMMILNFSSIKIN